MKTILRLLAVTIIILPPASFATNERFPNPLYIGIGLGYGDTTWSELIDKSKNAATATATPIKVKEGGFVASPFIGYEFSPYFALEVHYTHFPQAHIKFSKDSLYCLISGVCQMKTHTDAFNVNAKIMAPLFNTPARFYSDAGIATIHRRDALARTRWRITPTFGAGFNYMVTQHIMAETGFQFYIGYGRSQLEPVDDFVPFLYTAQFRVAYRFDPLRGEEI